MLTLTNIKKVFGAGTVTEHVALNNLNLHVDRGDFISLIGSNGAGKSTLFNSISGYFWTDGGSIILDGQNITYEPEYKRAAYIGRLFQDPMMGTAPKMTILENLALSYSRHKRRGLRIAVDAKDTKFFRDALAEFDMGLEDRIHTKVGLLSGGQRQALTLLMATIVTPKILLLDEHTAALDPATAQKVMKITHDIIEKHKLTALMITHNIQSALTSGNRTIMLDSGKVILDITGEERENMTLQKLMEFYANTQNKELSDERILLA